jgi:redox-sensitive bicupin YhaK (pirin superfamily)
MMVGAFIFFDHVGLAVFPPGKGVDVRPHPHINLATVTYLFEGALLHRDSLGSVQEIQPGAVNWMTAGKGIVHSERSPDADRQTTSTLHGIQTWVALPDEHEETEPSFVHYPSDRLPTWTENGAQITIIAGQSHSRSSPVQTFSPILYLGVQLSPNARVVIPADYSERAIYSVTDGITVAGTPLPQYRLAVLEAGTPVEITATATARCVVVGGEPVGDRLKWWNLVSSRGDRIEQAKDDWRAGRFAAVPEETEFIPLPPD